MTAIRFWLQFDDAGDVHLPSDVRIGCGVTAFGYEDALSLVQQRVFGGRDLPIVTECIKDVDVSSLDPGHVLPNMRSPVERGIWYPLGYYK